MKINTRSLYILLKSGTQKLLKSDGNREDQRYLISNLPRVYSKSRSQDESQEESVFLLSVALSQHATDGPFFFFFFNILELHEYRGNNYFALIYLKHHINYEILGCKQKLALDERWGNGTWGGMERKYLED